MGHERLRTRAVFGRVGWLIAAGLLAGVWVAWWALGGGGGTTAVSTGDAPPQRAVLPADTLLGRPAPDFTVRTTSGETFRLSEHRGEAVVFTFLTPGCPSCAVEVRSLTDIWWRFKNRGLKVLLVDVSGGPMDQAEAYYRSLGGGRYLYAADEGFRVMALYGAFSLGTTVVVNGEGIVSFVDSAATPPAVLVREVRRALP